MNGALLCLFVALLSTAPLWLVWLLLVEPDALDVVIPALLIFAAAVGDGL